jgi:hypothetical protein
LFFFRSISFVLLMGTALLLAIPRVSAQGGGSIQSVGDPVELPDKPQPQVEATPTGRLDDPQVGGQSGGTAGKQSENIQQPAPGISVASISGTVTDTNGGVIGGATIELEGSNPGDRRTSVSSDTGAFQFDNINPGVRYQITIAAQGLQGWKSPPLVLEPGQFLFLTDIKLKVPNSEVSVTVYATQVQIATEQVVVAEKQRILGIIPNFFVTYDPHPVPLTTKLKYRLAFKASTDPVTFVGIGFMAAVYQAGDVPDYQQGWDGYAQRVGAGVADTATDIFFGGAILPSLLHQDPRYFYQGTGTTKSRMFHAISYPYICKGDNGKTQPNYSSLGGDLISGAISNIYYPETNRGVGLVFEGFFVTTAVRTVNSIIQEFVLRKLTPSARQKN